MNWQDVMAIGIVALAAAVAFGGPVLWRRRHPGRRRPGCGCSSCPGEPGGSAMAIDTSKR